MSKAGLYIGIGLGVVGVGALAYFLMKKPKAPVGMSSNSSNEAIMIGNDIAGMDNIPENIKERVNGSISWYASNYSKEDLEKGRVEWNKKYNRNYDYTQFMVHKVVWGMEKEGDISPQVKDAIDRKFGIGKYAVVSL